MWEGGSDYSLTESFFSLQYSFRACDIFSLASLECGLECGVCLEVLRCSFAASDIFFLCSSVGIWVDQCFLRDSDKSFLVSILGLHSNLPSPPGVILVRIPPLDSLPYSAMSCISNSLASSRVIPFLMYSTLYPCKLTILFQCLFLLLLLVALSFLVAIPM